MPNLSAGNDYPNPYNLFASDFEYDDDSYTAALRFLGDLASGVDHDEALESNSGSLDLLRTWQRSQNFRRVYGKCKQAGDAERKAAAEQDALKAVSPQDATGDVTLGNPSSQTFVPLEALPARHSVFSHNPPGGSWGRGG